MPSSGVILDSGNVLICPTKGRWFPPPAFYRVLAEQAVAWQTALLDTALAAGEAFLDEVHPMPLVDEQAERSVWVRYYEIVLEQVGLDSEGYALAEAITAACESTISVEPYSWTRPVLRELAHRGVPVVVLSNAWPSLRRWYRELQLDRYIGAMVISGEEGITKPDQRVFEKAVKLLGADAGDVTFVDDHPGHVRAAIALGMRGLRLLHADDDPAVDLDEITDLHELLARL